MTITKSGIKEATPDPNIIRHPNWPFKKVALGEPFPAGRRFIHDTTAKQAPVVRQVLDDKELSWQADEKKK